MVMKRFVQKTEKQPEENREIMRCISVINFKGGVVKSSLAMNLSHLLTLRGYQVLLVDCDLQANSSSLLASYEPPTLTHFLQGQSALNAVVRSARNGLYVIPSDRDLNIAAAYIHARRSAYYTLRNAVWQLRGCDFVLFDHAPGYTPVTEAALLASREILIPCELEPFAVQGLFHMFHKLDQTMVDHRLMTTGIVPWNVDRRYLMTIKYLGDLKKAFGHLIAPLVRSDATIPRAQSVAQTIFEYNPRCRAAGDLSELVAFLTSKQAN
jgi:chromosome partitioning protein